MAKVRKHGVRSRTDRRLSAEILHEEYNKLTTQQKLDKLPPTGSNKERKKLENLIKFGRKITKSANPSKNNKDNKPSRRERWELKQQI